MQKHPITKNQIINEIYSSERALYAANDLELISCRFEGEEDGESALKECSNIVVSDCHFELRYPLWHTEGCLIENSEFTITARAPIWYTKYLILRNSIINAPKSIRECINPIVENSTINSDEAFWKSNGIVVSDSKISGGYLFLDSTLIRMKNTIIEGKYLLQYIHSSKFMNCKFYTKDAFWHAKDVIIMNSIIEGEYLGWYCENVTFINCHIKGTQPLCYCKNLKIIDCTFEAADLAFENSDVEASINGSMISIKNPLSGKIVIDDAEIIIDDQNKYNGQCEIILRKNEVK